MVTTIQISQQLQKELSKRKLYDKETYEEVIWDLIEDTAELSDETKNELDKIYAEMKAGKYHTLEEVEKELGL